MSDGAREEEEGKGPFFLSATRSSSCCRILNVGFRWQRRFESAISRRARKLRRLDHSEAGLEKAMILVPLCQTRLSFPSVHSVTQ